MQNEEKTIEEAKNWVKVNKKEIIKKFSGEKLKSDEKPFTIFMAGSPGAGKTETSKNFIRALKKINDSMSIARIDADEIREIIPGYDGSNSDLFQAAASIGVEKLYDHVIDKRISAIVDGTLASLKVAHKNITRSLEKKRKTSIFYVYQDPLIAWEFTKIREKVEGRSISKETFIESFFAARENIKILKNEFGNSVEIFLIIKNFHTGMEKSFFNVSSIDSYLKKEYTKESLTKKLC